MIAAFVRDESGATAIEYGVLAALLAMGLIAAFTAVGGGLEVLFTGVNTKAAENLSNASGLL